MARRAARVSGNAKTVAATGKQIEAASSSGAANYRQGRTTPQSRKNNMTERFGVAREWQYEAYRHVNICGEARYAVNLFAAVAARAALGIAQADPHGKKPQWVLAGEEVDALNELAPTSRDRSKLIRDYMIHRVIAGECYLIARDRQDTDPPSDDPKAPVWEIVAVTEIQKVGETWRVRHDNGVYIDLAESDPVIRMWDPDPHDRREAWSPFRSLLPTLREIEWLTKHIFTQVRSRLMSAGVWFLPDNLTFPPPPPDAVEGGEEAIAAMNEAEQFMVSLAASSMQMLEEDEPSFPSIVMADAAALANVAQEKLIKFWSDIDDKAMTLRDGAIQRFALGMDLPPEQILGGSGVVSGRSSAAGGQLNHWGQWALDEQTITAHIEPALDAFVLSLTNNFLLAVCEGSDKIVAYDSTKLPQRPDRSKEATALHQMGVLKAEVMVRENGFDPENDMMDDNEFRRWLITRLAGSQGTPEQLQEALKLLGVVLPYVAPPADDKGLPQSAPAPQLPGRNQPPSLEKIKPQGPPEGDHLHHEAPYSSELTAFVGISEMMALRALEKFGNRLLNDGKRGRDKDRATPPHMAHCVTRPGMPVSGEVFDFSLANVVLTSSSAAMQRDWTRRLGKFCADLVNNGEPYTREALLDALNGDPK